MRVTVEFEWQDVGGVELVEDLLVFPTLPIHPGLYRYRLTTAEGARAYVGEAMNLRRRADGYRLGYASM